MRLSRAMALSTIGAAILASCAPRQAVLPMPPTAQNTSVVAGPTADPDSLAAVNQIAARYLRLTLEAGTYEEGYIDAYYGPADEKTEAEAQRRSRENLIAEARVLVRHIDALIGTNDARDAGPPDAPYSEQRRLIALRGALVAAETRLRMIGGERLSFADEARGLFGVDVTTRPLSDFDPILARLERSIPGTGPLADRVVAFNNRYVIAPDRLRPVFEAAIAECRRRTAQHIALPEGESFTMHFVTDKPWSGYNYYLGNYQSRIEINTDLPIRISRAVDLGCHEGYPGHHVLNLLIEQRMARGGATGPNGRAGAPWREYLVNPLYSPLSVLSEGSANYGIDLAFPGPERLAFERDVLYPLAGLDPATAEVYWQVQQATDELGGARLTIARMYLDREITREQAIELTQRYLLTNRAGAEQSVRFTDTYRTYVLNYGWGRDLVRRHIERGGVDAATRWRRMEALLGEPTVPGDLMGR
jgi:hypothetical protein